MSFVSACLLILLLSTQRVAVGQEDMYADLLSESKGGIHKHNSVSAEGMLEKTTKGTYPGDVPGLGVVNPPQKIPEPITSYLACAPPKIRELPKGMTNKQYVMERLRHAAVYTYPFLFVHFCNFLPTKLYQELSRRWPVKKVMVQGREVTGIHNSHPEGRFKLSMFKLQDFGSDKVAKDNIRKYKSLAKNWGPDLKQAQKAWKEFTDIIFSQEFQDLLLKKLDLHTKPEGFDSRIQSDVTGYSVGVHADSVKKLLTMQFYFPQTSGAMYHYGTCVHTPEQFANRGKKCNGCAPCYKKFMFQANSGYTFPVHNSSYHSAPGVMKKLGERRTALLNWYKIPPDYRGVSSKHPRTAER